MASVERLKFGEFFNPIYALLASSIPSFDGSSGKGEFQLLPLGSRGGIVGSSRKETREALGKVFQTGKCLVNDAVQSKGESVHVNSSGSLS